MRIPVFKTGSVSPQLLGGPVESCAGDSLYFNRGCAFADLRQVVGHLHSEPSLSAASEGLVKTDRHFRQNAAFAVYEVVECPAGDAEYTRASGDAEIQGFEAVEPY